tara:strand:- start:895 stop:1677 length:783 start_codon:yes stop_codon:yes gene_type:complete
MLQTKVTKKSFIQLRIFLFFLILFSCKSVKEDQKSTGFYSIFNGESLKGWKGDSTYWRVENGILIGEVTPETILKSNTFIIYEEEQPDDFELKLEYKITELGNSGINYRSDIIDSNPYALRGYQCDIDGKNKYTGQNYEEKKRTTLAYLGEKVIIPVMPDSLSGLNLRKNIKKNCWQTRDKVSSLGDLKSLKLNIKDHSWNKVHLIIKGNQLQHYVNGVLMSDVTDLDTVNKKLMGYIGVQVHVGPPMKVEYRNIRLKQL